MEKETGIFVVEWRIENFSHWCAQVHGECVKSPWFFFPWIHMELYPRGISGQGEHLVMRFCGVTDFPISGDLSFYSSTEFLLCKQPINSDGSKDVVELPPGPKFEVMLSIIREGGDFITVRLRKKHKVTNNILLCTTINVLKISFKMNPGWIEKIEPNETEDFFHIEFSPNDDFGRMWLKICSKKNIIHFKITPPTKSEYPFAVYMCVTLTGSDGIVDSCVKEEHVFLDDNPWTFPDSMQKNQTLEKGISVLFLLKTKNLLQSPFCINYVYSYVSIETNNTLCFSEKAPTTDPITSNKVEVLTKNSETQTSVISDIPGDSVLVLSKELICLYQDQNFSDITLKCGDVSFPAHKNILSARSPVFKTMLSTDMAEATSGEVVIGDLGPSTLSRFLTYLYTGSVEEELQDDRALKLYYAADKYQVPSLKRDCSKFLCDNVSISNVCDILSLADRHRDNELTAASHDFILDNFNDVLKSKEWEMFMDSEPLLALKTVTNFAAKDCVFVRKQESK